MSKLLSNAYAYSNGLIKYLYYKIVPNNVQFGIPVRVFCRAEANLYKDAKVIIGKGVRIDKGARVACTSNAFLEIEDSVSIGANNFVICRERIKIGKNTILGPNVLIYDHDHKINTGRVERKEFVTSEVVIGQNCWIGAGTIILKGTHIGDNCVIAAGSVVSGDIDSNKKLIQKRKTELFCLND